MTEDLIAQLGYVGFFLVLVLGGLGLPVPEEVPVILAAVLSRKGTLWWPFAFGSCLLGVLAGDFLVYFLGYFYGEKVLKLPLTRKFLTKPREAQIKGYFHRHGIKILIVGRFAVGFRTAAYLTAGILKLPALRLFLTDLFAATLSTTLMFGLGYLFAQQIERATAEIHRWQHWITFAAALGLASWLLYRFYRGRQRIGQPVGPPVLVGDAPLPPDDLHSGQFATTPATPPAAPEPAAAPASEAVDQPPLIVEPVANGEGVMVDSRRSAGVGAGAHRLEESRVDPIRDRGYRPDTTPGRSAQTLPPTARPGSAAPLESASPDDYRRDRPPHRGPPAGNAGRDRAGRPPARTAEGRFRGSDVAPRGGKQPPPDSLHEDGEPRGPPGDGLRSASYGSTRSKRDSADEPSMITPGRSRS